MNNPAKHFKIRTIRKGRGYIYCVCGHCIYDIDLDRGRLQEQFQVSFLPKGRQFHPDRLGGRCGSCQLRHTLTLTDLAKAIGWHDPEGVLLNNHILQQTVQEGFSLRERWCFDPQAARSPMRWKEQGTTLRCEKCKAMIASLGRSDGMDKRTPHAFLEPLDALVPAEHILIQLGLDLSYPESLLILQRLRGYHLCLHLRHNPNNAYLAKQTGSYAIRGRCLGCKIRHDFPPDFRAALISRWILQVETRRKSGEHA